MRICLINPPHEESLDTKLDPPLGLMYLSSILKRCIHDVKVVDLSLYKRYDSWEKVIPNADVYGISTMTASYHHALMIRDIVKEINPECVVMVGGAHPSALPNESLKDFDIVVVGEAEGIIGDIIDYIKVCRLFECRLFESRYMNEASASALMNDGYEVHKYKWFPKVFYGNEKLMDIDNIPFPDRDGVRLGEYTRLVNGERATSIIGSRGCPYSCNYCINSTKELFSKVRFRSVENVIDELILVKEKYGFDHFIFYDDTFTIRPDLDKLLEEIGKLNITFRCNGNARKDDISKFRSLYIAGCKEIDFGIESGSQEILDKINKKVTVEQNRNAILEAKKAGLNVKAFLMVGSPGESWDTVEETVKFMWDTRPQYWTLFQFVPLPGCSIWKNPEKYGIKIIKNGRENNSNWREYFNIAGQNEGGLVCETEYMNVEDIANARKYMIEKLPPQTGPLQKYYEKLQKRDL